MLRREAAGCTPASTTQGLLPALWVAQKGENEGLACRCGGDGRRCRVRKGELVIRPDVLQLDREATGWLEKQVRPRVAVVFNKNKRNGADAELCGPVADRVPRSAAPNPEVMHLDGFLVPYCDWRGPARAAFGERFLTVGRGVLEESESALNICTTDSLGDAVGLRQVGACQLEGDAVLGGIVKEIGACVLATVVAAQLFDRVTALKLRARLVMPEGREDVCEQVGREGLPPQHPGVIVEDWYDVPESSLSD